MKKENIFEYKGPSSLKEIEKRLLQIDAEKSSRVHNAKENYSGSWGDEMEVNEIAYLDVEKDQLQLKRQFILDGRHDWKAKLFWNIVVPILVSVATAILVSLFLRR